MNGRNDDVRSLTFGAYPIGRWLPGKKVNLALSTWDGYWRRIERHILPAIGHLRIRRLRVHHLEKMYERMLHPTDERRPLSDSGTSWGSNPTLFADNRIRGVRNGYQCVPRGVRQCRVVCHRSVIRGAHLTHPYLKGLTRRTA